MYRLNRILLTLFTALGTTGSVLGDTLPERGYWHDMGWGVGGMLFGSVMMLVFWGGLIALVVLAIRWFSGGPPGAAQSNRAREILEERFARGEIDKEEFEERKRLLSN